MIGENGKLTESGVIKVKKNLKLYKTKVPRLEYIQNIIATRYLHKKNIEFSAERTHRMAVFANDWIGAKIFLDGLYERNHIYELLDIFSELDIDISKSKAIDVGANIGNHTLFFAEHFRDVQAFEPNIDTYNLLEYNTNSISNICTHNIGVSDKEEFLTMSDDPSNHGGSSAVYEHSKGFTSKIKTKKLDVLIEQKDNIGLIKIDVEGLEYKVLKGATNVIRNSQPIIAFEQHTEDFTVGENDSPSTQFLKELGYSFCWSEIANKRSSWLLNKLKIISEIVSGKITTQDIVSGDCIPRRTHSMLIAIPPVHREKLNSLLS